MQNRPEWGKAGAAAVTLVCGRLCCGKTTYAQRLRRETGAVVLSVDEIMLALFGRWAGPMHDEYVRRIKAYLLQKSLELLEGGIGVILDWGFWTRSDRETVRAFCQSRGIPCALHYLDVDGAAWQKRIDKRNRAVAAGDTGVYEVDEALLAKFHALFEPPAPEEIDVWVR